ncbi:MAG TPA: helix-turn-helix transcriptional regulator, partial [Pirellulales bacterium]|nr:helix-turn-helix transcriptional regulator [Pirellulales bacterium]
MPRTKDFAAALRKKLQKDRDLASAVEREMFNANVAEQIYLARTSAGLTQRQLADRIGSHQSVIARLEDSDYDSHSLAMLKRIAEALAMGIRVE